MEPEAKVETETESDSSAFLFKSLKRLYVYAQIFGCASFSYTAEHRIHVTIINAATFLCFTIFYSIIAYLNNTLGLSIDVKGYQYVLFYIGQRLFVSYILILLWGIVCLLFISKSKIAHLMEEIIALDGEVCRNSFLLENLLFLRVETKFVSDERS